MEIDLKADPNAEARVKEWNSKNPPNTRVQVTRDDGTTFETRTTGRAYTYKGKYTRITVHAAFGTYSLDRIKALEG